MTAPDDTSDDGKRLDEARNAAAAGLGLGDPIGDGPAEVISVDDAEWWAERANHLWRRWHGGLMLSPAPFDVSIRLGVVDDELVVTGLHIETNGEPLRDRDLREVSLHKLLGDVDEAQYIKKRAENYLGRDLSALAPRRPGRTGYPDEHFEEVAEVYRQVRERYPTSATARTAQALHASPATIRRWVARARELGYLEDES